MLHTLKTTEKNVDVVKHFGSNLFSDEALIIYEKDKDKEDGKTDDIDKEYGERVKEKMKAVALLKRLDEDRYTELKLNIRDQFTFGIYVYPKTLNGAYNLLENHNSSRNLHSWCKLKISKNKKEQDKAIIKCEDEDMQGIQFTQGQ